MDKAVFYLWALIILFALYVAGIFILFLSLTMTLKQTDVTGVKSILAANASTANKRMAGQNINGANVL